MQKDCRAILSSSRSLKYLKSRPSDGRLSLFRLRQDYLRERNTPANHEWKISLRYYLILFRALGTKSYEKGPFGVFSCVRSDSLNMNDTKFSFIGLVKLNIERSVLGTKPSSLRFVKHMSLDLSSDKLYRVFVTLFELVKPKRGTH